MRWGAILGLCIVAALLQIHLLQMASGNLQNNLPMWIGTVQGQFHDGNAWPGYRSRLLGVDLILLFGGDIRAYMEVAAIALTIAGLLAWRLGGAAGLVILHACFAVFASPWFSPWDMFEPAIFIAFVVLVVEGWDWYWFTTLFAIAIFNLQSAMFIPLWMVASSVLTPDSRMEMLVAGLSCALLGIIVMWHFQHSGLPRFGFNVFQCLDGRTTGRTTDYAQERLIENLHKLCVFDTRAVLGVIAAIVVAAVRIAQERLALGLTFLALLGATIVFGIVDEMRVWLPFIPALILAIE